jgi:hypothetical protein
VVSQKDLKALIKTLRANGVVSFKHEGLELLLDPNFQTKVEEPPKHIPGQLAAELNKASPGFLGLSQEEVLMYSSESSS